MSYSKENTFLEARMKPVPKKPKIVPKGPRPQENYKSRKKKKREQYSWSCKFSSGVHICNLQRSFYESSQAWGCEWLDSFLFYRSLFAIRLWMQTMCHHSTLLPEDRSGWVHTWVPDTLESVIYLSLLQGYDFPSRGVEDTVLGPECVQSGKKIMRNFTRGRSCSRNYNTLLPCIPS